MAQSATPAEGLAGCGLLIFLFAVGSCVFGGSEESEPKATPSATAATSSPTEMDSVGGIATSAGGNILERAILDAFPVVPPATKAAIKHARDASAFVGATINSAGYLCSKPIEAQQASVGQYGVSCRKHRDGGLANYLIDTRSGGVTEL